MIQDISISSIRSASESQMRVAGIDPGTVAEYADSMNSGAVFPAITLFFDGGDYWLGDGFHRFEASRRIGKETILAEIKEGGQRDAILFAVGSNDTHGLRRSQADKRRSIETMLRDPEWSKGSDREIGKACAVDHKTVGKLRREMTGEIPTGGKPVPDRHGKDRENLASGESSAGTVLEKILAGVSDDALIAECHRRGIEVASV